MNTAIDLTSVFLKIWHKDFFTFTFLLRSSSSRKVMEYRQRHIRFHTLMPFQISANCYLARYLDRAMHVLLLFDNITFIQANVALKRSLWKWRFLRKYLGNQWPSTGQSDTLFSTSQMKWIDRGFEPPTSSSQFYQLNWSSSSFFLLLGAVILSTLWSNKRWSQNNFR